MRKLLACVAATMVFVFMTNSAQAVDKRNLGQSVTLPKTATVQRQGNGGLSVKGTGSLGLDGFLHCFCQKGGKDATGSCQLTISDINHWDCREDSSGSCSGSCTFVYTTRPQ
jgi:hypothetical protein